MRVCTGCQQEKALDEFGAGSRNRRCRTCIREYSAARYQRTKIDRLEWERWAHLRKTYGISQHTYGLLFKVQLGRCAICRTDTPGGRGPNFHIDHDHACCPGKTSCGKCIRGLLCFACNAGLGQFRDSPALLQAAQAYLTPPPAALYPISPGQEVE